MAKRKRLTPAQGLTEAPEIKSAPLRPAPIAQVASEAATTHALQELTDLVASARAQGRLIQSLPLTAIEAGHLVRDRLLDASDEDMETLEVSLKARGQQTPIDVVALEHGRFGLISGLRRLTALARIGAETVLARVIAPETASDAYVAMIEENEIRADLSLYERARIVFKAVEAGVFPDTRDALLTLYAATPRAKRSKIKSVVPVVEALDDVLRFPKALSERACLELARHLEEDAAFGPMIRRRLSEGAVQSAQDEADCLKAPGPVDILHSAPETLEHISDEVKNTSKTPSEINRSHSMQTDNTHEKGKTVSLPHRPLSAFEPVPGVYVQSQTDTNGHTRLIFSGPKVTDGLRHKISQWLRAEESKI